MSTIDSERFLGRLAVRASEAQLGSRTEPSLGGGVWFQDDLLVVTDQLDEDGLISLAKSREVGVPQAGTPQGQMRRRIASDLVLYTYNDRATLRPRGEPRGDAWIEPFLLICGKPLTLSSQVRPDFPFDGHLLDYVSGRAIDKIHVIREIYERFWQ